MITTPEQMREAAARDKDLIRRGDVTAIPLLGMTVTQIERAIRAIPIAPQPVAVTPVETFVMRETVVDAISYERKTVEHLAVKYADYLNAIAASPQPVAVTIKPLVWYEPKIGVFWADTLIKMSNYRVFKIAEQWRAECGKVIGHYATIELAKAAAQADYEARILSALTAHPADPLSDPRVKALVRAAGLAVSDWAAHLEDGDPVPQWVIPLRAALRAIGGEV